MVKVKGFTIVNILVGYSFNHPMVKVKVITRLLDIVKLGVSTTLW